MHIEKDKYTLAGECSAMKSIYLGVVQGHWYHNKSVRVPLDLSLNTNSSLLNNLCQMCIFWTFYLQHFSVALACFIALRKNPWLSAWELEDITATMNLPFSSVPVWHRVWGSSDSLNNHCRFSVYSTSTFNKVRYNVTYPIWYCIDRWWKWTWTM